ncbi:alpha-galactosidase [Microbacterium trichothecenolyticum]|uniref:Alpha-galactosidase n=1 Tax=Microbacterium trichothecenolyticum TaxID=69370 RepID=A0ABU0TWJ0_MICTR|nr:alpha-galactosidase [Microbacterium trichothecenolyticum]MDQ1124028.1 alpha-galactosidase [Microbacterium trichothecenolyticum]
MTTTSAPPTTVHWKTPSLHLEVALGPGPVRLLGLRRPGAASVLAAHPLIEVFLAAEGRVRSAAGYTGSRVGSRLRYVGHEADDDTLRLTQLDPVTGLEVASTLARRGDGALRVSHRLRNTGEEPVTVTAVSTLSLRTPAPATSRRYRLVEGRSEWLGEGDWSERPLTSVLRGLALDVTAQDARGRHLVSSTGGWSTGSVLPTGVLVDAEGDALAWQVEVTAGWLWELSQRQDGVVVNVCGPTDLEHQFAITLAPGDEFVTAPAGLAVGADRDAAIAALTRYRRAIRERRPIDAGLPVVYNDFMNTLMGQPSTEALEPLIAAAAAAGAEYFCIDAGWFTDATEYWDAIGVWREASARFTGGLASVIRSIRDAGMVPGLWIEPEIVGVESEALAALPDDAWFQRHGAPVVEADRRHLDLRHPAARAHMDDAVDHLVSTFGVGFIKIDYNIEPGAGTDRTGAPGLGLLEHGRALRAWLRDAQRRHPEVLFENCASGAMRMDYALLSVAHLQSTSDQQDPTRSAAVTASAPLSVLPEQAGNWAYPAAGMSRGELSLSMVNGIMGRLYLSGHLDRLDEGQFALVREAVDLHKELRHVFAESTPFWPLGVPGWDDPVLALGFVADDGIRYLAVWSRGEAGRVEVPAATRPTQIFPTGPAWTVSLGREGAVIDVPAGPDAAIFRYE